MSETLSIPPSPAENVEVARAPERPTVRVLAGAGLVLLMTLGTRAHDVTTKVTWNREISRIVYARCASCHRPGGAAFSLIDYSEASPWAAAIKESVLRRQMPPWGAVKGFGDFRNDAALSQEQIDLIVNWIDGGVPEGNPDHLPTRPRIAIDPPAVPEGPELTACPAFRFERSFTVDGFRVAKLPKNASAQVTIEFPDGRITPLVWLFEYASERDHPFLLRTPLDIPAGATLRGLPAGSSLVLLPATPARDRVSSSKQTPSARQ